MVRGVMRFMRAPAVGGEAALLSLFSVAVMFGFGLASGRALIPTLLWVAGVGIATRLSDLLVVWLWRLAHPVITETADEDEQLAA